MLGPITSRDSVGGAAPVLFDSNGGHPTPPAWHAAYVQVRHERRVADALARHGIDHYLPLYDSVRRWSDRRIRLALPLFPGYVFVRTSREQQLAVLRIQAVVRLVGFGHGVADIAEDEMATLRSAIDARISTPCPYLRAGSRVRIRSGPLTGLEGVLRRSKGKFRMVVNLDLLQQAVSVELESCDIEGIA